MVGRVVLDEAGYTPDTALTKRFLDPCCGSGNFLIHAIARFRAAAIAAGLGKEETLTRITGMVFGFDLSPLAVVAARLNYLLAVADLLPGNVRLEVPVYMADAVYAPAESQDGAMRVRTYTVGTVMGDIELKLPEALVQARREFGMTLSLMERSIELADGVEVYLGHLEAHNGIGARLRRNPSWRPFLAEMYARILHMEQQNWNRIWCRVVRNYFASIAVGKADVVAGNPPWVRWSELPADYRERIKPTCRAYDILSDTPYYGGNELDISGMIAYIVTDRWVTDGGTLSFVITQVHFQGPSSQGFRSFALPDGTPLKVTQVHDFTQVAPFPKVANKPAVFTWQRGSSTVYPVPYDVWRRRTSSKVSASATLQAAMGQLEVEPHEARPIPPDERWCILLPGLYVTVAKLQGGSSAYQGRKGITTDLNGAYFVVDQGPAADPGTRLVRNQPSIGEKPVPQLDAAIESCLLYPLLKGAGNIRAFAVTLPMSYAIVPNKGITSKSYLREEQFRVQFPAAYRYFSRINQVRDDRGLPLLEGRSTWRGRMRASKAPFYTIANVGEYTFAPYKVVWAEMAGALVAAVASPMLVGWAEEPLPIVPDHKVYFVGLQSAEEAHYLCAMLNSKIVAQFVNSFTVKLQVGTLFRHLNLPTFEPQNSLHSRLAELSTIAHSQALARSAQAEIDGLALEAIGEL